MRLVSGQGEEFCLELIFGDAGADDLILHFAVLEKQEKRDRANVVFDREIASIVDVDFADLCLVAEFSGELVDDGPDHFAWAAPFGPEIDEDGHGRVDDFGIEIVFSEIEGHGG